MDRFIDDDVNGYAGILGNLKSNMDRFIVS